MTKPEEAGARDSFSELLFADTKKSNGPFVLKLTGPFTLSPES